MIERHSEDGVERARTASNASERLAQAAELRDSGQLEAAERLVVETLESEPRSAEAVLLHALLMLDRGQANAARAAIERWLPALHPGGGAPPEIAGEAVFAAGVSDGELELAFDTAETDRDQVIDADAIAERAIRDTGLDLSEELAEADASFRTRTVAELLERQGDARGASRIRTLVESGDSAARPERRIGRRHAEVRELERWLDNLRGGRQ